MGVYIKYNLTSIYGKLLTLLVLWPIGSFWCFMDFGPYHLSLATYGLRPYPLTIGISGQFSTSPIPSPIPLFWARGLHLPPLAITRAFRPTPFTMGSEAEMAFLGHLGPLWGLQPIIPGPWDPWAPFGPNAMCPKGAKGAIHHLPRPCGS
ncbi:hypothetical protein O181_049163 [Austropuccinia psidii MF-1]|uniref:Uncharacterized protein n=1 Tax=Austropuccinia psidii MF-1 TaxID=1389203 RepID=A0A9Q3DWY9_9BASI|nr:hypothetical protein [Austropuccinia psidii MF-1]